MATPALMTEDIARAVKQHLTDTLRTHLDAVEARWSLVSPLTLASPTDITFGFEETVLRMPLTHFPRVAILAAPVEPQGVQSDQRMTSATHTVVVEWLVLGIGSPAATVTSWRYAEALVACMRAGRNFAGFSALGVIPRVQEGQAMRHNGGDNMNMSSSLTSGDTNVPYLAGGVLTYSLQGRYVA